MAASVLAGPGQRGKHEMLRILTNEISRVEKKISSDSKLKKMAELQSTVVTDSKNKQAFLDQVYMKFRYFVQRKFQCIIQLHNYVLTLTSIFDSFLLLWKDAVFIQPNLALLILQMLGLWLLIR